MSKYKTLTFGIMHFTVAVTVAYALTGHWGIALGIGSVEPLVQTFAYAMHEKVWAKLLQADSPAPVSCCHPALSA